MIDDDGKDVRDGDKEGRAGEIRRDEGEDADETDVKIGVSIMRKVFGHRCSQPIMEPNIGKA